MFLFLHGIQQLLVVLVKIILVYIASRILYLHVQTLETVSRVASSDLVRTEVIVHTINVHMRRLARHADNVGELELGNTDPTHEVEGGVPEGWSALRSLHLNNV